VLRLTACAETGQEFIQIYLLGPTSGPFALNAEEISEGRWIHPEDLDREVRHHPEIFAAALRFLWTEHRGKIVPLTSPLPN
jgi:isopentenyldiphosphate isomerase